MDREPERVTPQDSVDPVKSLPAEIFGYRCGLRRRAGQPQGAAGLRRVAWRDGRRQPGSFAAEAPLAGIVRDLRSGEPEGVGAAEVDRKPRRRGGKARKRGLSREQVPVLVAADRAGRLSQSCLD